MYVSLKRTQHWVGNHNCTTHPAAFSPLKSLQTQKINIYIVCPVNTLETRLTLHCGKQFNRRFYIAHIRNIFM